MAVACCWVAIFFSQTEVRKYCALNDQGCCPTSRPPSSPALSHALYSRCCQDGEDDKERSRCTVAPVSCTDIVCLLGSLPVFLITITDVNHRSVRIHRTGSWLSYLLFHNIIYFSTVNNGNWQMQLQRIIETGDQQYSNRPPAHKRAPGRDLKQGVIKYKWC